MPYMYGQLLNAQLENSVGNPTLGGTPVGRVYNDISNPAASIPKFYNGSAWSAFGASLMTANTTGTAAFNNYGNSETIYNTSAATLGTLALSLPSVTAVGQICRYVSKGAVTTLTLTGTVVIGAALTSLAANGSVAYQAVDLVGTFIRLQ